MVSGNNTKQGRYHRAGTAAHVLPASFILARNGLNCQQNQPMSALTRRDKWVCCSYIHRAIPEKLQHLKPGIFFNSFIFWSLQEKIVMEGHQATKNRQVSKMDDYILCITCTLNQGQPIPGSLPVAAWHF